MKVKTESDVTISRDARESIMPGADMYGDIPKDRRLPTMAVRLNRFGCFMGDSRILASVMKRAWFFKS
jgi:hypothetical protein